MEEKFGKIVDLEGDLFDPANRLWYGCPTLVCTKKGRLWGGWYTGGSDEPSLFNYLVAATSDDGGMSWQELFAISSIGEEKLHVVDLQNWIDPSGKLWLFWSIRDWKRPSGDSLHATCWAMTCDNPDDEEEDFHFSEPRKLGYGVMRCQPTVLKDGRWLLPVYQQEQYHISYLESRDNGLTFEKITGPRKRYTYYDEPMFVEHLDGSLSYYARSSFMLGFMLEHRSTDGGKSWSEETVTNVYNPNSRFFIQRLPSGRLLMIFNDTPNGRTKMTAALSDDDGKTWPHKLLLDNRDDISYPDATVAPDGAIYIVHDRARCVAGEILITRLREEDILEGKFVSPDSYCCNLIAKKPARPALGECFKEAVTDYDKKCFHKLLDWVLRPDGPVYSKDPDHVDRRTAPGI